MAIINGTVGDDLLLGTSSDDQIDGLDGNDTVLAGDGNDQLFGGAGSDYLDGGTGVDTMTGGAGNDYYVVDDVLDKVIENPGEGWDAVYATFDYVLGANVEGLYQVTGSAAVWGTGNDLDNEIYGNEGGNQLLGVDGNDWLFGRAGNDQLYGGAGDDYLDGGSGDDVMRGGTGHDIYFVENNPLDVIIENAGEGIDTVLTTFDYSIAGLSEVENLYFKTDSAAVTGTGNSLDNEMIGNALDNVLDGQGGNDVIFGRAGNDTINGGAGNDYLFGNAGNDSLIGGSGHDKYAFGFGDGVDTITDLSVAGEGSILTPLSNTLEFGAGVTLNDIVLGFSGGLLQINVGGGGDMVQLSGFNPNDAYDTAGTHAVDGYLFADGSWLSYQQLMDFGFDFIGTTGNDNLTGTSAVDILNGYDGDDMLNGAAGNDQLYGGRFGGTDTMNGGAGNDTYQFTWGDGTDTINDTALPGEGNVLQFGPDTTLNDLILSYGNGFLQIEVGTWGILNDMVCLSGFNPNDAYGAHAVDTFLLDNGSSISYQQLIDFGFDFGGTAGNDTLTGTNATDFFNGEAGNDTLIGGAGNDTYTFLAGGGQDTIVDTDGTVGNSDRLFLATANPLDLVFSRQANDLRIAVYGSSDQVTVQDWYLGANHQIETIAAGNGENLLNTQVDQLIQAMATFSQQTGLTWEQGIAQQPQQVHTVLAGSWA